MSKKSETIRIGLLMALIAFAVTTAFTVFAGSGDGIATPAHALFKARAEGGDSYPGGDGSVIYGCSLC